jgi:N-acetylmuramic acid 6-phosphate etherase
MTFKRITEQDSLHNNLEDKSVRELLIGIHQEDQKVIGAVNLVLPEIEKLIKSVISQLKKGGRLFYIGAGTSGRLGILDASECPPTFGSDPNQVVGIIAGGKTAVYKAVENAEDNKNQGWDDLKEYGISSKDIVVGIAASGTTPYVIGALRKAQENKIPTGSICCNPKSPLSAVSDLSIEVIVGPEFVTGSSRMKAGTAQKLILNMITTATMIRLGHIRDNKMVDMQMTNKKLKQRAVGILKEQLSISEEEAINLISENKSIRKSIDKYNSNE